MKRTKPAYILVATLMITSMLVVIATISSRRGLEGRTFAAAFSDSEKALFCARSGVEIAIDFLTRARRTADEGDAEEKNQKRGEGEERSLDEKEASFFKTVFQRLNRWQAEQLDFGYTEDTKVCYYIACENGKINLNSLYNDITEKKETKKSAKFNLFRMALDALKIQNKLPPDLDTSFENFIKERGYPLNDVSELLTVSSFSKLSNQLLPQPESDTKVKELRSDAPSESDKGAKVKLFDLFSVWSGGGGINPWFISSSLVRALGGTGVKEGGADELSRVFKKEVDWESYFGQSVAPVYGIKLRTPSEITEAFNPKFEAQVFSVLSYGTVGRSTRGVFAVVGSDNGRVFTIIKLILL